MEKGKNYIVNEEKCKIDCGLTEEDALEKGKNYIVNEVCEIDCGLNPKAPEYNIFSKKTCEYKCDKEKCIKKGMTALLADFK